MTARKKASRPWAFGILAALALAIGAYAFVLYGSPDTIPEQEFVTAKDGKLPDLWYDVLWIHAVSAGLALAVGWVQFVGRIRRRALFVHRALGLLYAAGVSVGAASGFYMALYADGGWSGKLGFAALSALWLFTLYRGVRSIVTDRDPATHGRWMLRNYALTCAAIALRIYTPLAALIGFSDTNDSFVVIAWLCWLPNLIVAERIINLKRRRRTPSFRAAG